MRVFLCEKPSQGKDIARVLGAGQRGSGCYSGMGIVVTWCIGHLVEAVPPEGYDERYKRWADATLAYPRTSAMLTAISEDWIRQADRADVRSEQGKMKM